MVSLGHNQLTIPFPNAYIYMYMYIYVYIYIHPDSKFHGANMRPIWGQQGPGGPLVGPMNCAIWVHIYIHITSLKYILKNVISSDNVLLPDCTKQSPASGHQVRCLPWVKNGTFNKEIRFLCGLKFFALNILGEYLQSSLHLMLQIWWKALLWKMCQ